MPLYLILRIFFPLLKPLLLDYDIFDILMIVKASLAFPLLSNTVLQYYETILPSPSLSYIIKQVGKLKPYRELNLVQYKIHKIKIGKPLRKINGHWAVS